MKIGIITAMPEEARAIIKNQKPHRTRDGKRSSYRFSAGSSEIILIEAGMGMLNAGWAATALAADGVDLLISAGFGGGVLPGLLVGDVVVAEKVLHWGGSFLEPVDTRVYELSGAGLKGVFITSDGILNKQELAGLLPGNTHRPVVEMESASVARVAAEHGIPFIGIRAISDPWNEELKFSIEEFCDTDMRIRPPKVLGTILRRPTIIPQLIRLGRNSGIAARSLGTAIERLLGQL